MFLRDPELERQVIAGALAHGDPRLVTLAQEWLRDTGQAVPAVIASRVVQPAAPASAAPADAPKPGRYLRGVR